MFAHRKITNVLYTGLWFCYLDTWCINIHSICCYNTIQYSSPISPSESHFNSSIKWFSNYNDILHYIVKSMQRPSPTSKVVQYSIQRHYRKLCFHLCLVWKNLTDQHKSTWMQMNADNRRNKTQFVHCTFDVIVICFVQTEALLSAQVSLDHSPEFSAASVPLHKCPAHVFSIFPLIWEVLCQTVSQCCPVWDDPH